MSEITAEDPCGDAGPVSPARAVALFESEQQFQQLVAAVTDCAIYVLDADGRVASWNPGAERINGYAAEEILGKHFRVFYTEDDRASGEPERALEIVQRTGKYENEAWRLRKDGTRFWASVLIDPIEDRQGKLIGFAKITRDMTERRALQEQLHQSQKMEALGQLTGGVAHDFNNLLTVMLGNLEVLWRELPQEQAALRQAVDQATRGARRAAALTRQLLAFSRRQPLDPKPTDVNHLLAGTKELMKQALGKGILLETNLYTELWHVDIDAHQLESALLNLVVNARDAMAEGGTLSVETANARFEEPPAVQTGERYAAIPAGDYVRISVHDTGAGMTKDVMARAFDPFFTTKPAGAGTGLGLSQVFGFVNQSGGHVQLHSEPGRGTTVTFYLPRTTRPLPSQEPAPTMSAPCAAADATILIVEDDDDVRMLSARSLREQGFTVLEARGGASAMHLLEQHPEVQLLFTDVGYPQAGGRLADEARRRFPGLKILFTTGYARDAIAHQGGVEAGIRWLAKPFTGTELVQSVCQVLTEGAAPEDPKQGRLALVVEDEPLVSLFLAETLTDLGFKVLQSDSAQEAWAVTERAGIPDLAVVDVGLSDDDGLELAEEFRNRWPNVKIAISSGCGEWTQGRLHDTPGVTFLAKPYDGETVVSAVHSLGLGGR